MNHHIVEKEYRDFADDIEAVSIHYLCVPNGADADWDNGRVTRFMPLVEPGVRRLRLKLPAQVVDPASGKPVHRYMLFHYFEIFRGGDRHYSQIYSEVVDTGTKATAAQAAAAAARPRSRRSREIR
ncbi:MAG: hypothetical protein WB580_07965 [Candidatus Binataceae bacterium]